jgi:hypothetical protein
MATPILVAFAGGPAGPWKIDRIEAVVGESLPIVERLSVFEGHAVGASSDGWTLRGVTSNTRYAKRVEVDQLRARSEGLDRPRATRAALIPIRKTSAWWELAQDERRAIFEEQSRHTAVGMEYLPAVARRLHHCRELHEPFDFLTWFEYAPEHADAFEEMVRRLRDTPEWRYVDREVDIRLSRA